MATKKDDYLIDMVYVESPQLPEVREKFLEEAFRIAKMAPLDCDLFITITQLTDEQRKSLDRELD